MSQQALIDAAKASVIAYSEKNWDAVAKSLAPEITYDEVATHRKLHGVAEVTKAWKGWAEAFPDSKATFEGAHVAGDHTVILELTWRGTQTGPLHAASGTIPPTNKKIEMRAVQVVELAHDKTRSVRQYFDMATMLSQLGVSTASA
jgi:steroid delta-isomerase-like uncharacterized protein